MFATALRRQCGANVRSMATVSEFMKSVPMGPADPILGLNEMFQKDTDPRKTNLGVGAYRDDGGKPYVLDSVREAEKRIVEAKMNHEYAGIAGIGGFVGLSLKFAYGDDSTPLKENRVAGVQTLSGTGACRLAGEFYSKFLGKGSPVYMPDPTWGNHIPIFTNAGMDVRKYTYLDRKTQGLDFEGMLKDIDAAPERSVFLLHACAHNPTGVDPSVEQWKEISQAMKAKNHLAFFDSAYQGFASGDAERDAAAIRTFVDDGHCISLSQSFAKNFGLYGERIGAFSFVCQDDEEAKRIESQLKILIRPMYSNPPVHGARIVETVLSDDKLKAQWYQECKGMADRINSMRDALKGNLEKLGSAHNWNHVTDQIGMFCYSGMNEEQVNRLREEFHIYMTKDGRISMAGVTSGNVEYLAESMHAVSK